VAIFGSLCLFVYLTKGCEGSWLKGRHGTRFWVTSVRCRIFLLARFRGDQVCDWSSLACYSTRLGLWMLGRGREHTSNIKWRARSRYSGLLYQLRGFGRRVEHQRNPARTKPEQEKGYKASRSGKRTASMITTITRWSDSISSRRRWGRGCGECAVWRWESGVKLIWPSKKSAFMTGSYCSAERALVHLTEVCCRSQPEFVRQGPNGSFPTTEVY